MEQTDGLFGRWFVEHALPEDSISQQLTKHDQVQDREEGKAKAAI